MKRILLLPILIGICASFGLSQTTAVPSYKTDFQFWNETQIIVPLDKKKDWNFVVSAVGRFGNNVRATTDARIGLAITKKVNKYVTLSGGYLYQMSNSTFVKKRYASRYIGIAIFTVPLGHKFTFINRNELQYESRYSRPDAIVFRPRAMIKREVAIGKTTIEPFVSWEPFYDSLLNAITRYREQVGFSHKFNPRFSADFFYVRQDETKVQHTPAGTLNGLGMSFKITVR